jgi:hypothetical protein
MKKLALTKEQKAAHKALKTMAENHERMQLEFKAAAALAAFKAELPKRLMDAQALAGSLGVATHVELTTTGPSIRFEYENHSKDIYFDHILTYQSNEWEIDGLEKLLQRITDVQDECKVRMACAKNVFDKLTDEEKSCMKEYIHYLK